MDVKGSGVALRMVLLLLTLSAIFPLSFSKVNQILDTKKPSHPSPAQSSASTFVFPIQGNVYPDGYVMCPPIFFIKLSPQVISTRWLFEYYSLKFSSILGCCFLSVFPFFFLVKALCYDLSYAIGLLCSVSITYIKKKLRFIFCLGVGGFGCWFCFPCRAVKSVLVPCDVWGLQIVEKSTQPFYSDQFFSSCFLNKSLSNFVGKFRILFVPIEFIYYSIGWLYQIIFFLTKIRSTIHKSGLIAHLFVLSFFCV